MERVDNVAPKSNNQSRIILGIVFLTLGALLFADNFDLINWHWHRIVITWQMLLIVIGLFSLVKPESRVTGIILIAIGAFFLTAKLYHFPFTIRQLFWPTVFAALGLILIFSRRGSHKTFAGGKSLNQSDFIDEVAIFGGGEQKITSKNFRGGKVTNIFGGSTLEMLEADLAPGSNVLDMFCLFGGSKFIVPTNWKVRIEVVSIFGGYSDKRKFLTQNPEGTPEKELVIRGTVIFGGGEIKSL